MNAEKYLSRWQDLIGEDPDSEEFIDYYSDLYMEVAGFFSDGIEKGLSREVVITMCYSLLVHHMVKKGVCPACELHQASITIHDEMNCPDVH